MKTKKIISFLIATIITANCLAQSINKGLVIYVPFDNGGQDLSLNKYNGTLLGGANICKESIVGNGCVYLDGKEAYIEFPSDKVYFNGDYSISIWCKMLSTALWSRILDFNQDKPQAGNAVTWLIGRSHKKNTHDMWFDQWVTHKGIPVESIIDIMQQNPANAYLDYDIIPNEWAHYVITYSSKAPNKNGYKTNKKGEEVPLTGKVTLYVNGKKAGTNEYCLTPQNFPTKANWLGRSRFSPDPYYKGYMDDFRIYNRVVTLKEVKALYALKSK